MLEVNGRHEEKGSQLGPRASVETDPTDKVDEGSTGMYAMHIMRAAAAMSQGDRDIIVTRPHGRGTRCRPAAGNCTEVKWHATRQSLRRKSVGRLRKLPARAIFFKIESSTQAKIVF